MSWTAVDVSLVLREATETLDALPNKGLQPNGYSSIASGFAHSVSHLAQRSLTPTEVSAMDAVMRWPDILPEQRHRMIIRLRAEGLTWRSIGMMVGISHVAVQKAHHKSCTLIARALNLKNISVPAGVRVPSPRPLPIAA